MPQQLQFLSIMPPIDVQSQRRPQMDLIAMFKSLVEVLYHYLFTVLVSKRRASINAFRNEKGNLYGLPNQHRPATLVLHEQCRPIGSLIDTQARTSLEAQSCTTTPRCPERGRRRDRPGRGRDDVRESARSVMCDVRCVCNMACMISENHQPHRRQPSLACFPPAMHTSCSIRCSRFTAAGNVFLFCPPSEELGGTGCISVGIH
ncbi:uncharacterized protein BKA55DRAFT_77516 [Fusarium redolens]|uniref:Uncharacterized protein n=1 Tax=Fusarium redolens TaxID=48865 RepID=A0A9P9GR54_FUSRE|nr:uncharacterized protein BKA55DRAFT_77516 [Fusarium redolens]KAH7244188.1 hypothetical protein BKA55DRAFT_77516 [Fusarium redolens]